MRKFLEKVPLLPLSALLFYLSVLSLWKLGILPSPENILILLENLYEKYGLIGLSIATFLEGIVYLGLYFPGSFIILLSVILSDGSIISFLVISLVVSVTLTLTSIINYVSGRYVAYKENREKMPLSKKASSKGLFWSMIHPNLLAFYFFNAGIKKQNPRKILFVPFLMMIYGFVYCLIVYLAKDWFRTAIENPLIMITLVVTWIIISFAINARHKRTSLNNSLN